MHYDDLLLFVLKIELKRRNVFYVMHAVGLGLQVRPSGEEK